TCMPIKIGVSKSRLAVAVLCGIAGAAVLTFPVEAQTGAWLTHSHDQQHTALSTVQSQPLSQIHWQTPVDLDPARDKITVHYGSPLVTANTVIVPVKTGTDSFRVDAHEGAGGKKIWTLPTSYYVPN